MKRTISLAGPASWVPEGLAEVDVTAAEVDVATDVEAAAEVDTALVDTTDEEEEEEEVVTDGVAAEVTADEEVEVIKGAEVVTDVDLGASVAVTVTTTVLTVRATVPKVEDEPTPAVTVTTTVLVVVALWATVDEAVASAVVARMVDDDRTSSVVHLRSSLTKFWPFTLTGVSVMVHVSITVPANLPEY